MTFVALKKLFVVEIRYVTQHIRILPFQENSMHRIVNPQLYKQTHFQPLEYVVIGKKKKETIYNRLSLS